MSVIVNIDHETGDLSQYTTSVAGGGDLSAAAGAALAGTGYGLSTNINDAGLIYAEYSLSEDNTSTELRIRIYFKVINIEPDNRSIRFLECINSSDDVFLRLQFYRSHPVFDAVDYVSLLAAGSEGLSSYGGGEYNERSYIEVHIIRSSVGQSDGGAYLYFDGDLIIGFTDSTRDLFIDFKKFRVGYLGSDTTPNANYFIDEIIINDDGSEIGADVIPSPVVPTPSPVILSKWKYDVPYYDRSFDVLEYNRKHTAQKDRTWKQQDTEG